MKFAGIATKAVILLVLLVSAVYLSVADTPTVTVKGYVLDSACAFTKGLDKPISKQCATACANAGSALVILADDGTIYWPIAHTTPSSGQNPKLLPFAGDKVTVSGRVYQRGGSNAIVIEKIESQTPRKQFLDLCPLSSAFSSADNPLTFRDEASPRPGGTHFFSESLR